MSLLGDRSPQTTFSSPSFLRKPYKAHYVSAFKPHHTENRRNLDQRLLLAPSLFVRPQDPSKLLPLPHTPAYPLLKHPTMPSTRTITNHAVTITLPARPRPLSDIEILDLPRPSSDLGHHPALEGDDGAPDSPPSEVSTHASLSPPATGNPFVSTATLNHSSTSLASIAITPSKDDHERERDGSATPIVSSLTRARAPDATSSFYDTELEHGHVGRVSIVPPQQEHKRQLKPLEKVLIALGASGFVTGIVLAALYGRKSI